MTRFNCYFIRNHEHRIKTDTELADQVRIERFVSFLYLLQKFQRSRTGNGADPFGQIVLGHADARIRN